MKQKIQGFSLIELIITLTLIGILTALCLPIYSRHIIEEHRLDAKIALEKLAATLEEYFIAHNSYQGATLDIVKSPSFIAKNNYQLIITALSNNYFSIAAKPLSQQARQDAACGTLMLNSLGKKAITGIGKLTDCW
ncbi:MAG: pilE [Gammaproteobacteria bacterium]|jgi:type IV pilus assembly protein PilE|nr:pilE [Gammaproteobacteria bacterium]MCE3237149.1 pilE [Gammaproteobacteria bacterium]